MCFSCFQRGFLQRIKAIGLVKRGKLNREVKKKSTNQND